MDFFAIHGHAGRGSDANSHPAGLRFQHGDVDVPIDHDLLVDATREN